MNLSLTVTFDTIEELQHYLNQRGGASAAPAIQNTPAGPAVVETVVTPIKPAKVAPAQPAIVDPLDNPAAPVAVDPALKERLMGRLTNLANSMEDPAALGKFINSFGVQRFSEIEAEDLPAFEVALNKEFGAE